MTNTLSYLAALKVAPQSSEGSNVTSSLFAGWHLQSSAKTVGINATSVWADYTGKGVTVGVFDDGIAKPGLDVAAGYGKHGTAVAGVIAGDKANGIAGVAVGAVVSDQAVIGLAMPSMVAKMQNQVAFDIVNHSWGWGTAFLANANAATYAGFFETIEQAAQDGRGGLGTVINVAAGNFKATGNDTNVSNFSNDRHVITVGAVTSEGGLTDYSTPGASVLIVAPSGGGTQAGVTTRDLAGAAGYSAGDTTSGFSGTSAATPQVSGVVALMLEANANLGWRDVKTILALSAETLPVASATQNAATNWNGGGLIFSNDVGFGLLDAHAAVRLAETWLKTSTSANEASVSGSLAQTATLADKATTDIRVTLGKDVDIETMSLELSGFHGRPTDLTIQLISPSGTVSTLQSGQASSTALNGWTFTSNAFLGESSEGTWTIRVIDDTAGRNGIIKEATLTAFGEKSSPDDTYVFTDTFAKLGKGTLLLGDKAGLDSINAAAVTSDSVISLKAGDVSIIAGREVKLVADAKIEIAFGGDGNDIITGNDGANLLWGGRGNDKIYGHGGDDIIIDGAGNDTVDGGNGIDLMRLSGTVASWKVTVKDGDIVIASQSETNLASNIERLMFDDAILAFDIAGPNSAGAAYRLYQAALDRAPDLQGLAYWLKHIDNGMSLTQMAGNLMESNEFQGLYANKVSHADFVAALYENVQNRVGEAKGLDYWVDVLSTGKASRTEVLVAFSESTENVVNTMAQIKDGILVANDFLLG